MTSIIHTTTDRARPTPREIIAPSVSGDITLFNVGDASVVGALSNPGGKISVTNLGALGVETIAAAGDISLETTGALTVADDALISGGVLTIDAPIGSLNLHTQVSGIVLTTRRQGDVVIDNHGTGPLDLRVLMGRRLSMTGTVLRARPLEEKIALARDFGLKVAPLFERGVLRPVVDHFYRPDEAGEAHRRLAANDTFGKLALLWE